jgi:hypothetical protein
MLDDKMHRRNENQLRQVCQRPKIVEGRHHDSRWVTGTELLSEAIGHGDTQEELMAWGLFEPRKI